MYQLQLFTCAYIKYYKLVMMPIKGYDTYMAIVARDIFIAIYNRGNISCSIIIPVVISYPCMKYEYELVNQPLMLNSRCGIPVYNT